MRVSGAVVCRCRQLYAAGEGLGTAIGVISGLTLGAIIGSHTTDDTYIVISEVNIGVVDNESGESTTTIIFGSNRREEIKEKTGFKRFREHLSTRLAAYAGGRNAKQSQIADGVRKRLVSILRDII